MRLGFPHHSRHRVSTRGAPGEYPGQHTAAGRDIRLVPRVCHGTVGVTKVHIFRECLGAALRHGAGARDGAEPACG